MPGPDIFLAIEVSLLGVLPSLLIKNNIILSVNVLNPLCINNIRVYNAHITGLIINLSNEKRMLNKQPITIQMILINGSPLVLKL